MKRAHLGGRNPREIYPPNVKRLCLSEGGGGGGGGGIKRAKMGRRLQSPEEVDVRARYTLTMNWSTWVSLLLGKIHIHYLSMIRPEVFLRQNYCSRN